MSTTVTPPAATEEQKPFDPKAFIAGRNANRETAPPVSIPEEGSKPPKPAEAHPQSPIPPVKAEEGAEGTEQAEGPRLSRSQRREHNRLLRELGEATGRAKALEELLSKKETKPAAAETEVDPEPKEGEFGTYDAYSRALARWEARQETTKTLSKDKAQTEQQQAFHEQIRSASTKAQEDRKEFADWEEVAAKAKEEGPEWKMEEHPIFTSMLVTSDMQAAVMYHFAKNPQDLETMLSLTSSPDRQIAAFHRLEGRLEKAQAAQASEAPPKDRKPAEKPAQGSTAVDRDVHKPKPSSEVAATGGSAPPEEPPIGSKAWMARRNQAQYAR